MISLPFVCLFTASTSLFSAVQFLLRASCCQPFCFSLFKKKNPFCRTSRLNGSVRKFVFVQGNRKWSSASDAFAVSARLSRRYPFPPSEVFAFAACSFLAVLFLFRCGSAGCFPTALRSRWPTFSSTGAKSALVTDYCLIPFASCWLRIKRQLS